VLNCELAETTVHGYFDGELDAVRSAEFERHLANCAGCQTSLEGIEDLCALLQRSSLYEYASPRLRERIRKQVAKTTDSARVHAMYPRRWALIPVFAIAAVAVFTAVLFMVQSHTQSTQITAELIDAHVRSLQPGHLTDVLSTDQHTVKPWFDGKLDFIPPVSDYSGQGFPLLGGRLDVVDGHNVAAVVYSRRKHIINLFVWPYREQGQGFVSSGSRQGYNWTTWETGDMRFCLISDAALPDLHQLKDLINR
jgi:anti-sigma factor RsiW